MKDNLVLYYPAGSTTATRVYGQGGDFTTNGWDVGASGLSSPTGIAVDSKDNLYVVDTFNVRVLYYPAGSTAATRVYGQEGSFTTRFENNGGSNGGVSASSLDMPNGVALDSEGNLYVTDTNTHRVLLFPAM